MDDDGDDKDDTKRKTRNLSEKKRRDQFNMLVHELSTMVSTNNRKMDKSTVLKSTISFLRNHNEITVRSRAHDVQEDWKPSSLSNEEFTYLVLEALEGFIMVFSATGKIYYVSESITSLLGHNPVDVVNKNIFDLTYEEDRPNLYNLLQSNVDASEQLETVDREKEMVRFMIHLRRGSIDCSEDATYELIQFNGHFKTNMEQLDGNGEKSCQQDCESRVLFVCTGRLNTPQLLRDVSLVDSSRNEFTSRHSLEWKFLFLDHRAPPIIGYLPFEVLGTSGYDYYHFDDLEKVVTCHEALMQKGELTSCYYRFLTKGQQWIWLQTRFYITYHQWNSKPEFVVCTHRVVSYADISKNPKEEGAETDTVSEAEANRGDIKEAPSDEANMVTMSPNYNISENSDAFPNTYHTMSQSEQHGGVIRSLMKDAPSDDQTMEMVAMSPSYMSETSDGFTNPYQQRSQPASAKSMSLGSTAGTIATAATTGASWPRAHARQSIGSDNGSLSGDSRSSHKNSSREKHPAYYEDRCNVVFQHGHKGSEPSLVPQHGIGAQYLDPAPYVGAQAVPGVLPLPLSTLPVIVSSDQAQIQEQLQRKHEELQQMIVRQQEELRQVKEQLLLARLGILQPLINVPNPFLTPEELQQQQQQQALQRLPADIRYESSAPRAPGPACPPPPHPHPQNPQHTPHTPGPHDHVPQ